VSLLLRAVLAWPWMGLSLLGELAVTRPARGVLVLAAIAVLAYTGWRLWKDPHISVPLRKLSLALGALSAIFFCSCVIFASAAAAHGAWRQWLRAGAGIAPGMTLDEARAAASVRSWPKDEGGLEYRLRPKGLASMHYVFKDHYGVALSTGSDGRVAAVRPWSE
jgi:hypothetical protein